MLTVLQKTIISDFIRLLNDASQRMTDITALSKADYGPFLEEILESVHGLKKRISKYVHPALENSEDPMEVLRYIHGALRDSTSLRLPKVTKSSTSDVTLSKRATIFVEKILDPNLQVNQEFKMFKPIDMRSALLVQTLNEMERRRLQKLEKKR